MDIQLDWGNPLLPESDVLRIETTDLEDFYASASDLNKANLYFVLLNALHHYKSEGKGEVSAHLSFLIAYYLFMCFLPPASGNLAMHYIEQAIALYPTEQYEQWREHIREGN